MQKDLSVKKSLKINSQADKVWDALINPVKIKEYLFGTNTVSDFKRGSSIVFQGEWEGKAYKDKGTITKLEPNKIFEYTYWSNFSGLEDKPENYSTITFELNQADGVTQLALTHQGYVNEQAREHSEKSWDMVLSKLKEVAEK